VQLFKTRYYGLLETIPYKVKGFAYRNTYYRTYSDGSAYKKDVDSLILKEPLNI
jgi:hypothetical protein